MNKLVVGVVVSCVLALWVCRAGVGAPVVSDPDANGFRWCTVGSPGNAAYQGLPPNQYDSARGRGAVNYNFRIARTEVTTAQWMEFLNAVGDAGLTSSLPLFWSPNYWGATVAGTHADGSAIWRLDATKPNAGMLPVAGIGWRVSAVFCNWLHNDKATTPEGLSHGAYETSTFGWAPVEGLPNTQVFTDQQAHSPGAKYWIPTLDEWLKAAYFDPAKNNDGPGWWTYPNASDTPLVSGPPGSGDTIVGYYTSTTAPWRVPLEAYPATASPWGLLDVSGGASEWVEEVYFPDFPRNRGLAGIDAGFSNFPGINSIAASQDSDFPFGGSHSGLRLASRVPSGTTTFVAVPAVILAIRFRTRRHCS